MDKKCYSFVIRPNDYVVSRVQEMRDQLGGSSLRKEPLEAAHILIIEFEAHPSDLGIYESYASLFMERFNSRNIDFSGFDALQPSPGRDNGVLYINPDKSSSAFIKEIASEFHANFPLKDRSWVYLSQRPALTLISGLSKIRLATARQFFIGKKLNDLSFPCLGLSLREFDSESMQFRYIRDYAFVKVSDSTYI